MSLRLDESLLAIHHGLGAVWLVTAIAILGYALFGSLVRGFGLAVLLLIAAQCWYLPAGVLGRNLRFWVLAILCVRGMLSVRRTARTVAEPLRLRAFAVALGAIALASALWSDRPAYTLGVAASFVASLVAAFWVLWRLMDEVDVIDAAARGLLWLAILVYGASYAVVVSAHLTSTWWLLDRAGWGGRFSGVFWNANMAGILGMLVVPVLVATPRERLGRFALLRFPAILLAASAVYLSGSRSALLGTALSLVILFLYRFGVGALLTVALGSIGAYLLVASSDFSDLDASAVGHITRTKHIHTLSGRVELWEQGFEAVRGRELLGLGWGSSRLLGGGDPEEALERGFVRGASNLHSTHVQILVDLGIVGLATLWFLCLQVLWSGWRLLVEPRTSRSDAAVMVLACFVATLADTFVHGSVLSTGSPSALIFWVSCAFILKEGHRMRSGTPAPSEAGPPGPAPACGGAAAP